MVPAGGAVFSFLYTMPDEAYTNFSPTYCRIVHYETKGTWKYNISSTASYRNHIIVYSVAMCINQEVVSAGDASSTLSS